MHHQITAVPGLERESAGKPAKRPALLLAVVESDDYHAPIVNPYRKDASREPLLAKAASSCRRSLGKSAVQVIRFPGCSGCSRLKTSACNAWRGKSMRVAAWVSPRYFGLYVRSPISGRPAWAA